MNHFFLAMIPCLENVFVAPYSQFMPLPLATVPETCAMSLAEGSRTALVVLSCKSLL